MIVNTGIRRFLGSAIQRLFNSASFYAPLTHSLVLERGTGSPTFTRATEATVWGYGPTANSGEPQTLLTVAANEARFQGGRRISEGVWSDTYADGVLISPQPAYLAEGARTNHFLNSTAPVTQTSGALATGTYTLWMDGTGSVAVAGNTATITGAGTATDGTPVTFVVTVGGTVDYTVTGTPTRAQAENGAFASTFITTAGAAVTRNADVLTYPSAGNISGTVGWVYVESTVPVNNGAPQIHIDDGSNNNRILVDDGNSVNGGTRFLVQSGGGIEALINDFSSSATTFQKRCVTWATNYAQSSQGGLLSAADTSVTPPVSFTQIGIGGVNGVAVAPCTIRNVRIGQRQLSASEMQAITA